MLTKELDHIHLLLSTVLDVISMKETAPHPHPIPQAGDLRGQGGSPVVPAPASLDSPVVMQGPAVVLTPTKPQDGGPLAPPPAAARELEESLPMAS